MANANDTKIAVLEERIMQMAEQLGILKNKQDEFTAWVHEHEKKELSHHNEVMQATAVMTASLKGIETDIQQGKEQTNSIQQKRKDAFDRILRIALAAVVLAGAGAEFVKFIGAQYNNVPEYLTPEPETQTKGKR